MFVTQEIPRHDNNMFDIPVNSNYDEISICATLHEPERSLPNLASPLKKSLQIQYYKWTQNVRYIE